MDNIVDKYLDENMESKITSSKNRKKFDIIIRNFLKNNNIKSDDDINKISDKDANLLLKQLDDLVK